jgi:murein DD-endopeptidase MepM/ murein hydrolase activator NlpD
MRMLAALVASAAVVTWASRAESAEPGEGLRGMHVVVHAVRQGESVDAILKRYRTTRGTLESLNQHLDLDALKPGDRVRILSRPGVFQRLQPGLTVSDVALAYGADPAELLRINGIANPRRIPANLELFVPDAVPLPEAQRKRLAVRRRIRAAAYPKSPFGKPLAIGGRLVVSDGYGRRRNPITGQAQLHAGADFVAPWGTPILAARDGVVTWSAWKGGYGKLVILRHEDGYETYYAHATELLVREGERVQAGQPVARVGTTGDATAPHLHFEVHRHGVPRDPLRYLRSWM